MTKAQKARWDAAVVEVKRALVILNAIDLGSLPIVGHPPSSSFYGPRIQLYHARQALQAMVDEIGMVP